VRGEGATSDSQTASFASGSADAVANGLSISTLKQSDEAASLSAGNARTSAAGDASLAVGVYTTTGASVVDSNGLALTASSGTQLSETTSGGLSLGETWSVATADSGGGVASTGYSFGAASCGNSAGCAAESRGASSNLAVGLDKSAGTKEAAVTDTAALAGVSGPSGLAIAYSFGADVSGVKVPNVANAVTVGAGAYGGGY